MIVILVAAVAINIDDVVFKFYTISIISLRRGEQLGGRRSRHRRDQEGGAAASDRGDCRGARQESAVVRQTGEASRRRPRDKYERRGSPRNVLTGAVPASLLLLPLSAIDGAAVFIVTAQVGEGFPLNVWDTAKIVAYLMPSPKRFRGNQ